MPAMREGFDIWICFSVKNKNRKRTAKRLLTKRFWKSKYVWHDSFGKYFNRLIGCRLFGHRKVKNASNPGEWKQLHCFNCERDL